MAVRHIKEHYEKVCEQYFTALKNIEGLEKEVMEGMVDPEFVDRVRENVQPIKDNYQLWCWIMFLLNQPNRDSKYSKYKKNNKNLLNRLDKSKNPDTILLNNLKYADTLKNKNM